MDLASFSIQGSGKPNNQDCVLVDSARGLIIVADGVTHCDDGGHASQEATRRFADALGSQQQLHRHDLHRALNQAQAALRRDRRKLFTTLDVVVVQPDRMLSVHVGDGRIYELRSSGLRCTTEDHSKGGYLANAVGAPRLRAVARSTPRTDELLGVAIATDGVWNEVNAEELSEILLASETTTERANLLAALLRERDAFDDATFALAVF